MAGQARRGQATGPRTSRGGAVPAACNGLAGWVEHCPTMQDCDGFRHRSAIACCYFLLFHSPSASAQLPCTPTVTARLLLFCCYSWRGIEGQAGELRGVEDSPLFAGTTVFPERSSVSSPA